ncbi:MAG: ABC transporter permease subunit [Firmicutes bacterium]|nr:ABC transporter permease subunit [Bacillota bacterium]
METTSKQSDRGLRSLFHKEKVDIHLMRRPTDEPKDKLVEWLYVIVRVCTLFSVLMIFLPAMNPARICGYISESISLLTAGVSYSGLVEQCINAFNKGWINENDFVMLYYGSAIAVVGILVVGAMGCMSLGSLRMRRTGNIIGMVGVGIQVVGLVMIYLAGQAVAGVAEAYVDRVNPMFNYGAWISFMVSAALTLLLLVVIQLKTRRVDKYDRYSMEPKFRLFLMFLPFAVLCFVFSYLPLWGWRYAFFNYKVGGTLSWDNFVGFYWFQQLFTNSARRADLINVLKNTLGMSGLGIATSWCAMAFAIFLSEIKTPWVRRIVQTFTTIPNFISWVLVYAIALAIFSTDGFISTLFGTNTNYLMDSSHMWLKMLGWGMWKGIGWSAIIYIAGISGIDQGLYEAATVDGAGRFQKMWHITVPGLIPTYMVMLLMSIAGILSNGMDQYLVFTNSNNSQYLNVLDLWVYNLGIGSSMIPMSTMIGMMKSLISVVLLFSANAISKLVRHESIF